jgi:hypothetical protein
MKANEKYRNNEGTVASVNAIRGNKVFFSVQTVRDQQDVGQTTKENFQRRFPIKVS